MTWFLQALAALAMAAGLIGGHGVRGNGGIGGGPTPTVTVSPNGGIGGGPTPT